MDKIKKEKEDSNSEGEIKSIISNYTYHTVTRALPPEEGAVLESATNVSLLPPSTTNRGCATGTRYRLSIHMCLLTAC